MWCSQLSAQALSVNLRQQTLDAASRNIGRLRAAIERVKATDADRLRNEYNRLVSGLQVHPHAGSLDVDMLPLPRHSHEHRPARTPIAQLLEGSCPVHPQHLRVLSRSRMRMRWACSVLPGLGLGLNGQLV